MSKARRRATAGALAFLTAAAAWGCGSSQAPEAPPAEIAETAQAPAPPANRPPVVRRVAIRPWEPVAGELLTAVADATDPDGDPVRLTYHWSIDGRRYQSGEQQHPGASRAQQGSARRAAGGCERRPTRRTRRAGRRDVARPGPRREPAALLDWTCCSSPGSRSRSRTSSRRAPGRRIPTATRSRSATAGS